MAEAFRRAGLADLPQIAALERACFGADDGAFSPRQLRALLANPRAHWLMTPDAGAMACWLELANGRARWARLYSLAVHPGQRGRGLAARLLDAGFAWMHERALTVCRAEVRADNVAARSLYARYGFTEAAVLPDYYGPGIGGLRLIKHLHARTAHAA